MPWPDQYGSAKFAAFRQAERDRLALQELREAAKPESQRAARSFMAHAAQTKAAEFEMQGAAVGAAAASSAEDGDAKRRDNTKDR